MFELFLETFAFERGVYLAIVLNKNTLRFQPFASNQLALASEYYPHIKLSSIHLIQNIMYHFCLFACNLGRSSVCQLAVTSEIRTLIRNGKHRKIAKLITRTWTVNREMNPLSLACAIISISLMTCHVTVARQHLMMD